jgi:hypothetical protein
LTEQLVEDVEVKDRQFAEAVQKGAEWEKKIEESFDRREAKGERKPKRLSLTLGSAEEETPKATARDKQDDAVSTVAEWADTLPINDDPPTIAEGPPATPDDQAGSVSRHAERISEASAMYEDMAKDITAMAQKYNALQTSIETLARQVETLLKGQTETRTTNNHFVTDLIERVRALERTLPHDAPRTTRAAPVVAAAVVTTTPSTPAVVQETEEEMRRRVASLLADY